MLCPVFQNTNPGVERLGVPPMQFNEALHGVVVNCGPTYNGNTGCPTSFPHATALGATFNRRCVHPCVCFGDAATCVYGLVYAHSSNFTLLCFLCCISLWLTIGNRISTEARALHNEGLAGLAFWAPDMYSTAREWTTPQQRSLVC